MPDRYRVIITPRAGADLEKIHAQIAKDSPQNAGLVASAIIDAVDSLETFPHRHPVHEGRRKPSQTVRRMPVPPFLLYYKVDDADRVVHLVNVLHGKRRQPKRFK
jgi:plasmid stabilization system protein ParE